MENKSSSPEDQFEHHTKRQAKQPGPRGDGHAPGNGAVPDSPPMGAKSTGPAITLTKFTNAGGSSLTKRVFLTGDALDSDKSAMVMSSGIADRLVVDGLAGLGELIETLKLSQALALGGLRSDLPDKVDVTTIKKLGNGTPRIDLIARTNENITYNGPAFVLLDFDTKGMPPAVAAKLDRLGGFWPALLTVLPELRKMARLTRSSTSAGLSRTDTGEAIPGSDGIHVFIVIKDGANSDRFLKTLHDRCWLAGFGWMWIDAAGRAQQRSIIDRSVGQSGRLVFESGPLLDPPLVQDKIKRRPIVIEGDDMLDSSVCPPLSIAEQSRAEELKAKDRARVKPEEMKQREKCIVKRTKKLRAAKPDLTEKAARQIIIRQYEGILRPDVVLPWDDSELSGCTVADVLADPAKFAGETMSDPLEGPEYGRCVAMVMIRNDGTPWIHSFAHGRTIYALKYDAASVRKAMEAAEKADVVKVFTSFSVIADLDGIEAEELRQLAMRLSGVGLKVINGVLRATKEQHKAKALASWREYLAANRQDPRPRIAAPWLDAPWLPVIEAMSGVIGTVEAKTPPSRDIDDDAMWVRKLSIPNTHSFTSANEEGDDK